MAIEWWIIIFTAYLDEVPGLRQEVRVFDEPSCQRLVDSQYAAAEADPNYIFTGRCEKRERVEKETETSKP